MTAKNATERVRPSSAPGVGDVAPRPANWRAPARIVAEVTTLFPGAALCHTAPPQGDSLYLGKSARPGLTLGWDRLGGRLHLTISRCSSRFYGLGRPISRT